MVNYSTGMVTSLGVLFEQPIATFLIEESRTLLLSRTVPSLLPFQGKLSFIRENI